MLKRFIHKIDSVISYLKKLLTKNISKKGLRQLLFYLIKLLKRSIGNIFEEGYILLKIFASIKLITFLQRLITILVLN